MPALEATIIIALVFMFFSVPEGADPRVIWPCLLLHYALMLACVRRPTVIRSGIGTYVTAESLFYIFSYLIFYFQYQLYVLGMSDLSRNQYIWQDTFAEQSNKAVLLASIGMFSFRAGVQYFRHERTNGENANRRLVALDHVAASEFALPVSLLLLLLIAVYHLAGWQAAAEGLYTGSTSGGLVADAAYLLITVLAVISVALWTLHTKGTAPRSIWLWAGMLVSIYWALRVLLNGDRNTFLLIGIAFVGGLLTYQVRGGRWLLVVLTLLALSMYAGVEALRSGHVSSMQEFFLSSEDGVTVGEQQDSSFTITGIGLRAALFAVPEHIDYGWGIYKLVGLLGVIPFSRKIVLPEGLEFYTSADLLTHVMLGPSATWGAGSNIIADAYLDFGVGGVIGLLFILGSFSSWVRRSASRVPDSSWRGTLYLMTLAFLAETPRYSFDFMIRPLSWTMLMLLAIYAVTFRRTGHRRRT